MYFGHVSMLAQEIWKVNNEMYGQEKTKWFIYVLNVYTRRFSQQYWTLWIMGL